MLDVTRLLQAIERGDGSAAEKLLPLVYQDLRRLAALRMAREAPGHSFAVEPPHDAGVALAKTASSTVETPPGYRWVSRPWRTLPNGRRAYAALHGEGAFRSLAPVSSHLREPRKH